ncbi:MAG: dihydroxy-acid dehydratase [Rhodospirillales bacterium]|jgi:dihydroxy-acid dehydratase|nr:dihydroxy-acid dehydratase [Rhodospirillales bacterium]
MSAVHDHVINPEFADLFIEEEVNVYRTCIQGLSNEPICVRQILARADELLGGEDGFEGLGDTSQTAIVERLATDRPRVCIIQGSADHPAHLLDHEHMLRASARIWQNGGVPFTFGVPVICDGTAQNNIGQSYSLASRNHTATAVNINFEGHSYHAAYVLSGCDKSPSGILSGLAAADRARRAPERGAAPVWATFVPSHVLRGGTIPADTRAKLRALQDRAEDAGDQQLSADIEENCKYILQCASDEVFLGHFERAIGKGLMERAEADQLLNELAANSCHEKGGVCAFNGTGNSSRTLVSALGLAPQESELLLDEPETAIVFRNVDHLFRLFNKPEFALCDMLARNYANAVRVHNATGSSTNLMLHIPCIMRHAGYDVTVADYERVRDAHPVPDIFAHSLTEDRDTYTLGLQAKAGQNRGMESIFRVLGDLGVPMDLDAPTVMGNTWGMRIADLDKPVSDDLPQEKSVIRTSPVRDISGTDVLRGNFFSKCALKVAGMATEQYERFNGRVFLVRYYENETDCTRDLLSADLAKSLGQLPGLTPELFSALRKTNGGTAVDVETMIVDGTLAFAFVIAGQGPKAFGMPEMFTPGQNLRHHGILERTSILMTDGRYSGVSKGACVGHVTPEAFEGGGIGALADGDLLWVQLDGHRIDLLDRDAFLGGEMVIVDAAPAEARNELVQARRERMEHRRLQVAACSLLDHVTDAEHGIVPDAVDSRAVLQLPG